MKYEPAYRITPALVAVLEDIAVLRERVVSASVQVPWVPALQKEARERSTHGSTSIEGNPLRLAEVRIIDEGGDIASADEHAKGEVRNYLDALRFVEKNEGRRRLEHDDVLKLHGIVMAKLMAVDLAGRYRPFGVRVGTHVAPPPGKVHGLMSGLLEWLNGPARRLSPVISSAILHFRFEDIHPFADGNGRTGRLLALWELYRRGFDTLHVFSVDEYFWENRPAYYGALAEVRDNGGDLTRWLEFVAGAVRTVLGRVLKRTAALSLKTGGETLSLRPRQERLLELLRDRKTLAPAEIWDALGVSRQGAMDILKPLMKAGLVKRVGGRKTGKYVLGG